MKILLTSPINPISNSPYSHRSAQAEIYAQMIYENIYMTEDDVEVVLNYCNKIKDYDQFDAIYVYHGNDWGGTLNLFGGPDGLSDKEGLVNLFKQTVEKIVSLSIPMPDYPALLRKRLKPGQKFGNILDELPESVEGVYTSTAPFFAVSDRLVVGDSHAISLYRPGWEMMSIPFKTLHGVLNTGIRETISTLRPPQLFDAIELYFGNIDIRHHLCRQPNPKAAALELAERYFAQAQGLAKDCQSVSIYEPLPIENESRKLPKTGYYKGTPFYGSWAERNEVRDFFADSLEQLCENSPILFVRWVGPLRNSKGELDFSAMEKPRSVHLARASYPYWKGFESTKLPDESVGTLEGFF